VCWNFQCLDCHSPVRVAAYFLQGCACYIHSWANESLWVLPTLWVPTCQHAAGMELPLHAMLKFANVAPSLCIYVLFNFCRKIMSGATGDNVETCSHKWRWFFLIFPQWFPVLLCAFGSCCRVLQAVQYLYLWQSSCQEYRRCLLGNWWKQVYQPLGIPFWNILAHII